MCFHPKHVLIKNDYPTAAYPNSYIELNVPCGKCVSCLRRRQSDYSARLVREVQNSHSMFFVTLTYNNQNIPLQQSFLRVCPDTGESEVVQPPIIHGGDEFSEVRAELVRQKSTSKARYLTKYVLKPDGSAWNIDGFYYCTYFTPSLYREDFKNWLKGCRVQYERDTGEKLDFRYAWCGEYGPRGSRPHYHACFLNLTIEQLDWMLERWHKGYTYRKEVPSVNPDGTNARAIAANYIAKYVSKGKFDCNSVLAGDAQKGRLCNSKRFGTYDFSENEKSYFLAYDLYGKYDIDTFAKIGSDGCFTGEHLSPEEINNVVSQVFQRSHYEVLVNGEPKKYPLPRSFRVRLFFVKDYRRYRDIGIRRISYDNPVIKFRDNYAFDVQTKVKTTYRASLLSRKVQDFICMRYALEHISEYKKFCSDFNITEDDTYSYSQFKMYNELDKSCVFESLEESRFAFSLVQNSKDYQ